MVIKQTKLLALFCLLFAACQGPGVLRQSQDANTEYFSLKKYFANQAKNLSKVRGQPEKSVLYEGKTETRRIKAPVWSSELELFSSSDINKPAWKGKYRITHSANQTIYQALDSNLKVKSVEITRADSSHNTFPTHIVIRRSLQNFLYRMSEELTYVADSGYTIKRMQDIRLLGQKHYRIGLTF